MLPKHDAKGKRQKCEFKVKIFIMASAILFATVACSTMNPVEMSPQEVQQKILSENILVPGKRARIVTADGQIRSVRITRVDAESGSIDTDASPIPIADIVAVETRDFSIGKTALLAAGSYAVLGLIALAVGPVFLL